jgi:DNA-binding GntR family transcriptional regulator
MRIRTASVSTAALAPAPHSSPSTPEVVAAALRDEVLDGLLLPGARLREEGLCERFGVGRHSVRAALRLLVAAGLVVHERHRGATVRPLSRARIDESFDFRLALELGSLRLALARDADLTPVELAVQELEALPAHTPWRQLTECHGRIHHEIVRAAGNDRLLHAYRSCEDELQLLFAVIRLDFSAQRLARLHRELVDALRVGGEVALRALEDDLERSGRAAVLQALARSEAAAGSAGSAPRARTAEPSGTAVTAVSVAL